MKYRGLIICLLLICLIVSCRGRNGNDARNTIENVSEVYVEETNSLGEHDGGPGSRYSEESHDCGVFLSGKNGKKFLKYLKDVKIKYPYEELYETEKAVELFDSYFYGGTPLSHKNMEIVIRHGKIDRDRLFQIVKQNNGKYLQEHPILMEAEDDVIQRLIGFISESIEPDLSMLDGRNIQRLNCILGDLKIVRSADMNLASVNTDICLKFNPNMIKIGKYINDEESERNTLYHEAKHLEQSDCLDGAESGIVQIGVGIRSDVFGVNSGDWLWLNEASAEKAANRVSGGGPFLYKHMVGYLRSLDAIALLSPIAEGIEEVENSTLNHDVEKFYSLMGEDNFTTKPDIIKMMYTMDIAQKETDFQQIYQEHYGEELDDENYEEIRHECRVAFNEGMARIFLGNLTMAIMDNGDCMMNDIYALLAIEEADIVYHLETATDENLESFVDIYLPMLDEFFELLAKASGHSKEQVYQEYLDYSLFLNEKHTKLNARFEWLNEEMRDYLLDKADSEFVVYREPLFKLYD